ncbi:MAG TPA: sigma-70 family RNA polymerase sigma factor [Bryobacteraceae bacterium]|nr:sigma-70 family RNA polymerase sigma factor [Bryobacteraceae bacterium]
MVTHAAIAVSSRELSGEPAGWLDNSSMLALYGWLQRRRFLIFGSLRPDDQEDAVNETFLQTLAFARRLRDPQALRAACYTIGMRIRIMRVREYARENPAADFEPVHLWHPERRMLEWERQRSAQVALNTLRGLDREIIQRFYFDGHSKEQIRRALRLTDTQFRVRKSRAISRVESRFRTILYGKTPQRSLPDHHQAPSGSAGTFGGPAISGI